MNFMEVGNMAKKKELDSNATAKKSAGKKVRFEFPAQDAHEVCLAGNFNNWDVHANPMKKDKKGLWKATVPLAPGSYEYRYIVDGQWENDPACSSCVPNEFGGTNCIRMVE
jgi:1,4-alpha-glucan branching enzyme